jgi:hypothetical protein
MGKGKDIKIKEGCGLVETELIFWRFGTRIKNIV